MRVHYDPLTEYMLIHANPHFHHPLTYYERCQIDVLWNQAHLHNMAEIAHILHRPEWTINREIRRVQRFQGYLPRSNVSCLKGFVIINTMLV